MSTIRQREASWARRALGLFALVWLNLALQPCAMAFDGDAEPDCPHCPPAHVEQHKGHDPVVQEMPCANGVAECGVLGNYNYDGRIVQLKIKDAPNDLPVALLAVAALAPTAKPAGLTYSRLIPRHPPGSPQALNKLYCVYLK